jgi:predicted 3-demethylubiquinone-9 3-methyltransferase (glyoxalase superfamily)
MQKITPFLWFDRNAEEAVNFYTSVFKNSSIVELTRYGKGAPMPEGLVMSVTFVLDGQEFMALNAGPHFKFNEAVSFLIKCKSQQEVDEYWDKLTSGGGEPSQCGWLKDKFGLWWQVIPDELGELLRDKDPGRAQRAMQAMLKMQKIDVQALRDAANSK